MRIALLALLVVLPSIGGAATLEPWSDTELPIKDGLGLWLASSRQPAVLKTGDSVFVLHDASGNKRDFVQKTPDAQPHIVRIGNEPAIRFDGKDDYLTFGGADHKQLGDFTVVLVVAPHSNPGQFRAFLAAGADGKNDYQSGFTIDMGPDASSEFDSLNAEGIGFTTATNLLADSAAPLDTVSMITVTSQPAFEGVRAYLNGKPQAARARRNDKVSIKNMVLGARRYSNDGTPPAIRGFFDGDVLEVLLYERVLSEGELKTLQAYLAKKHPALADGMAKTSQMQSRGKPLVSVRNPPDVQMFVPGFEVKKLPLDLTNINNVRYRPRDGKLFAVAYDGNIYLLSDTDGDGLEDKATLFFESKGSIVSPVGVALTPPNYPLGDGLFVACKGKLTLVVDTDGDDKADKEIVVATGWPTSLHQVDAVGVTVDPRDQSVYFGLGCGNFADPYLHDDKGVSHYDVHSERGTIVKVAPDFSKRESICTGIRFSVGLAFNAAGDLFCTDQEGATWLANGNPFDELLHIQPGRHYGFPPRHPTMLPNVIDEPSTFDYGPQHQSTCGLTFNEPVNGGPVFGPASWRGDALVCGESRGKLYRTQLAKTDAGYLAKNQLLASLTMLTIDSCVSPAGDLVVTSHSGDPDWGTGPTGKGRLYKIRYADKAVPQPVLAWAAGPNEVRIAFDREIDPSSLAGAASRANIDFGRYVAAGERFEKIRPGYAAVMRQRRQPRFELPINGVSVSADRRTIILSTAAQRDAVNYALTFPIGGREIDLAYDQSGVQAEWSGAAGSWSGWLPHVDLSVARAFTAGSAEHDALWKVLATPGELKLHGSLDLHDMLRPAVQPGSHLDYTPPAERVTLHFRSSSPLRGRIGEQPLGDNVTISATDELVPFEIEIQTGTNPPTVEISFTTNESSIARPLALRRFLLPWAKRSSDSDSEIAAAEPIPQLAGGHWLRGRSVFFGNEAACYKCHRVRGAGGDLGPDLSNLVHRDYDSVLRDVRQPSAALNPDYIASTVTLKDGRVLGGIVRNPDATHLLVRGDAAADTSPISTSQVKTINPSRLSLMPSGILEGIGPEKSRDLLTFLLTEPLAPAPIERKGTPPPRPRAEIDTVLKSPATPSSRPLHILLVAGPKDHGPSEHDYPAWQKRWTTLLSLADNVQVDQADSWPTPQQWSAADVAVFYSANPVWTADKGKEVDAFQSRGGGIVLLHFAVNGRDAPSEWADRVGLAWQSASKYRHGALDLTIRDTTHPIARGFPVTVHFEDEAYWNLAGDKSRVRVLAQSTEDGQPQPLMWTYEHGKGRVFVSVPGHYTWTFDDPLFRVLVLRGIGWCAGNDQTERLTPLATIGARMR